jgi:hypothetical protein
MYLKRSGGTTYFSECGTIAGVARTAATGNRTSAVRFLASEEASLNFEGWEGIVICGAELCKADRGKCRSKAETDEGLHY